MTVSDSRERLDELVFRYLERVEAGERPAGVLEELAREAPDLATPLRRGIDRLRDVQLHPGPSWEGLPEQIGGFRLLQRLGAGGMGVVYLARQETPSRQVALKLVRPDQLHFEGARERFTREIDSVARLAHPGIAAVYETGESDGVPWFTQEYLRGVSLEALLKATPPRALEQLTGRDLRDLVADALPEDEVPPSWDEAFFEGTWVEVCLRIVRQVADALQHAHERGVLHRDVKPSNVILTPRGRAVLVDFGLAALSGAHGITRSGAQLGSLTHMSPEQVDGDPERVGPASDVYSLGVTLYELLTLRAPYSSPSVARLQSLILDGAPTSPRRWNPAVGKDAATVCLCAMERSIVRRYATASGFAADVANVLAKRSTQARPLGPAGRLWRRCQRHPVATLLALLLVVLTPTVLWIQSTASHREQLRLNEQLVESLARESLALIRTETHFQGAIDAVETVMRSIGTEELANVPGLSLVRLEVADRALEIFASLERERPDDPRVRQRRAVLLRSRADALQDLDRTAEAQRGYAEALELLERCVEEAQPSSGLLHDLATAHNNLAMLLERLVRPEESLVEFEVAASWLQRAAALGDPRPSLESDRLMVGLNVARLAFDLGDWEGAMLAAAAGRDRARALIEAEPGEWVHHHRLFMALGVLGRGQQQSGNLMLALESLEGALDSVETALELAPSNFRVRNGRASAESDLGLTHALAGRSADAIASLERALAAFDELVAEYPAMERLAAERVEALSRLAYSRQVAGDFDTAVGLLEEVAETRVQLARRAPDDVKLAVEAALAYGNLANVFINDVQAGPVRFERALVMLEVGLELCPPATSAGGGGYWAFLVWMQVIALSNLDELEPARERLDELEALGLDAPEPCLQRADAWAEWALAAVRVEGVGSERASAARSRALDALEAAVAAGFRDRTRLETSQALLTLRGDPRFERTLERLDGPR